MALYRNGLRITSVAASDIVDGSIVDDDIAAAAAIAFSKLHALTSAHILVGSAGNIPTDTAITGDISISNTGVTAIGAGKISNAMVAAGAAIDFSKFAVLASGNILVGSAGGVATSVAMSNDATIIASGALTIANAAITYAKMQNISATNRLLGRKTAGAGSPEEITVGGDITQSGSTFTIGNNAVSNAKLAGMTRGTVKVGDSTGAASDLTASTSGQVLIGNGTDITSAALSGAITVNSTGVTSVSVINHSALTGLTSGDDHTQYALLAGRSGGQTYTGGTASGDSLVLKSTSNATKGVVGLTSLATASSTATQSNSETFRLQSSTWNGSVSGPGNFTLQNIASTTVNGTMTLTLGYDTGGASTTLATWTQAGTFTNNTTANVQFSDTTTTPISGQMRLRNTNSTVGNFASISFMNSNATAYNVVTVGGRITSHANPGSGQFVVSTANLATITNKMCISETGTTLIGNNITTSTAGAMLQVNGDTSGIAGIFRNAATTPSDLLQLQANGGSVLAKVDNTGLGTFAGLSITDATNIAIGTSTGSQIGTGTTQKIAFHGSTPVVQRVGAAQAAVATTGSTITTPFGYTTAAQADAIVTLVNELRAALVEKGIIKGSA